MMKFTMKETNARKLTFRAVRPGEYFETADGYLAVRTRTAGTYIALARPGGTPVVITRTKVRGDTEINRILPEVERIDF